ncbi:MAG TPA: AAA family ATPase [Polyangiaceae bacterium]|jgi:tetratricopeptide (TPR) repeat protein
MDAGTVIADRFEIVEQAGRGGMAAVHRARDRVTMGFAAVKMLHLTIEGADDRFLREAELLAKLSHPGIVGYLGHGQTADGRAFLAMSWVEGETLAARVRRVGRLAPVDVAELGANVADALASAHAAGIVHRDVKPSNLLLATTGYDRPVLVDFGIARVGDAASAMTREGMLIGTPGYISPEQARGSLHIDARADQFSLGCVLYACLTGHAPFRGEDIVGILAKILFQETPRVRAERVDVPPEIEAILLKAMAKEPADRFADAVDMARSLRKARARLAGAADSVSTPSLLAMPTPTSTTPGISTREARLLAMVIVGRGAGDEPPEDATFIGERFGGDVERLANGAVAVRFSEAASATERAFAAARCAIALRRRLPATPISLATVRGTGSDEDVVRAIDRAAELVRDAPRSGAGVVPIRIDETTAGLLDARFDVRRTEAGLEVVGESGPGDESRKLLGVAVPCIGRDRELLTLEATLEEVERERIARAVIVTADAGVGKSRLRREWLHRVRERGEMRTWIARADPLDSRAPHGLLGQAVRRALAIADDGPQNAKQSRLRDHLAHVLPDAAAVERVWPFAAEIIGAPLLANTSRSLAAARGDRALMADRLRLAFEEWIVAECKEPLLVVLDDAHWSDAATLRLLDAALGAAADHPLMVAVFARPPLRDAHPRLFAERRVQELRLEELSKRSAERLARAILGTGAAQTVVDRVVELSNGNAFFLEELVRAVADGKGQLPDSVLSVVEARLEALEPDARRVLRAASVFGQFFWPSGVSAVLGDTDEEAASAWIATLARREIVAPRGQSRFEREAELTFRHALVRDTAYSMLTPEDRVVAHRAAAAWLEARGEGEAAVLAAHLEAGGELEAAARRYATAASQMLGGGELGPARELIARGLACAESGETRAFLLALDAETLRWLGDLEASARAADEALVHARPGTEAHFRALGIALLDHLKLGHDERRRELLALALDILEHAEPSGAACRLAASAGTAAIFSGDVPTAAAVDVIAERLVAGASVDLATLAQLHAFRAFLSDARGDLEGQIRHFEAASRSFEQAGHERHQLLHRTNAAFARTLVGDYETAASELFDVLEIAERRKVAFIADTARSDLGATLERLGRYEEAREQATRAVVGFQREGDHRMEAASRAYLARALFELGRPAHAFTEIHTAVSLARTSRQVLPYNLAVLAHMELDVGSVEQAVVHAREAFATQAESRSQDANDIFIWVTLARALEAAGRTDEANATFADAYARFQARSGEIRDSSLRDRFAVVEENATLLAWASRSG